ncbi:AEC family transporter [Salarchaeum sp. JOR-1]|uniref:AEC family transporter n=1 Tax=Salarchaeum sp. JOR-1 TaxID=2599399 RepID=UPI001198C002|nr:AEC family transporter [Salarchaeum sp. JOR-1]QDX40484.1 AEC family transporter [Salarchaeum sp. JOR-1]
MSFVSALTDAILPVLAVALAGFLLGRFREVEVDALGTVTLYVLTPALVFSTLATTTLSGSAVVSIAVGVTAFTVVMAAVAYAVVTVTDAPHPNGTMLASTFSNAGNYGIPLSAFAFGATGRSTAVLFIAAQSVLMYSLGVFIAARGTGAGVRDSVGQIFELPLLYAVLAAGLVRFLGVVPPETGPAMETISMVGNAAIPVMLLMLGIQLGNTGRGVALSKVATPTVLKLAVAPVVALAVAVPLGFSDPVVARTFVLECAMPAAVTPLVFTVEFSDDPAAPAYVSTAILVTTLLSIPVLAVLLTALRGGLPLPGV